MRRARYRARDPRRDVIGAAPEVPPADALRWIGIDDTGDVSGIYDDRPLLLNNRDRLSLRRIQSAARLLFTGPCDLVVMERARDADARS